MVKHKLNCSKTVLIISFLDLLEAGNQVLFTTIYGYLRNRYRVVLLTAYPFPLPRPKHFFLFGKLAKNLKVYRFNLFTRLTYRLANTARRIKRLFNKQPHIPTKVAELKFEDTVYIEPRSSALYTWFRWFLSLFMLPLAIYLAVKYKPCIVYGYEEYGVPVAFIISRLFGLPLITKFQGTYLFPYFKENKKVPLYLFPFMWALRIPADLVIMENDGTRGKEVLEKLGVPEGKIRFWIDGVEKDIYLTNFDREAFLKKLNIQSEEKILLMCSRLKKFKRIDRAISIMPKILREVPNTTLLVVGDGEEKEALQNLAKKLGVERKVLFTGAVPHQEVKFFLKAADIFITLNDHSNLVNPLLEALEAGKCIVTLDDGSTKEILSNGYNAMLVPKNEEKLANVIIELLLDENLRSRLAANAREYAKNHLLSWEQRGDVEVKEVEKLIKQKRP